MGMTLSGVGLGTFVYPFLANELMAIYGWRGALLITSGMTLHVCVFGSLIGPDVNESANRKTEPGRKTVSLQRRVSVQPTSKCHSFVRCHYWLLHVHVFLINFTQSILYTHIIAHAQYSGHSHAFSTSLVSIVGLSQLAGRIIHGVVIHHPSVNVKGYYVICYLLVTVSVIVVALFTTVTSFIASMIGFGYFFASWGPVLAEVLYQVVGPDDFSYGYGFLMVSSGAGYVLGAPCAGLYAAAGQGLM